LAQIRRKGVSRLQRLVVEALEDVVRLPSYADSPAEYTDWGLTGPYKVKTARGECAA
jgi:hypothetical protein